MKSGACARISPRRSFNASRPAAVLGGNNSMENRGRSRWNRSRMRMRARHGWRVSVDRKQRTMAPLYAGHRGRANQSAVPCAQDSAIHGAESGQAGFFAWMAGVDWLPLHQEPYALTGSTDGL